MCYYNMSTLKLASPSIRENKVLGIILASGRASRLKALSDARVNAHPILKSLAPVLGMPAIGYSLEVLQRIGIRDITVTTNLSNAAQVQDYVGRFSSPLYDVSTYPERRLLGTAVGTNLALTSRLKQRRYDTMIVLACDTPHNIDLLPILENHLRTKAALTIGVLPMKWSSPDWIQRTFGTFRTTTSPTRKPHEDRSVYERRMRDFYLRRVGQSETIVWLHEHFSRNDTQGNLASAHIYVIDVAFWRKFISPFLLRGPADFGFHLFPVLFSGDLLHSALKFYGKLLAGLKLNTKPFNAFFVPEKTNDGKLSFWFDIGTPFLYWVANMVMLKAYIREHSPKTLTSFFGKRSQIRGGQISNCVIGDNTIIDGAKIANSVVLGGTREDPTYLGKQIKLDRCIVSPGNYIDELNAFHALVYQSRHRSVTTAPLS